jgi:MarR family transcriptional regulator for hemolysin
MIFYESSQRIFELAALISTKTRKAVHARVKRFGITADQFATLLVLGRSGGISQRELAVALETDTTTAMVICDGLERRGLIDRTRDPSDRRVNRLSMSEKAKRLMTRVTPEVERLVAPLLSAVSAGELERVIPVLEKLAQKARELSEDAKRVKRSRSEA